MEVARLAFQAKAAVASEHQKYKVGIMAARDDGQRYEDILTSNDRTREVKPMDTPFEAKVKPMDTPLEAGGGLNGGADGGRYLVGGDQRVIV